MKTHLSTLKKIMSSSFIAWGLVTPLILSGCGKVDANIPSAPSSESHSPCTLESVTDGPCYVMQEGVAVSASFGANISSWLNPTQSTTVTAQIPDGFYVSRSVAFTESALQPANIVSGATIFGVVGTATGDGAACATDGVQDANCVAANGTYWTNLLGTSAGGTNGSLVIAIPQGYHSGTTSATASDTNLVASNIRSGTDIFGVTGSLTPAYAACSDNALNAAQCSTAANRYVATAAGANVNGSNGQLAMTIPQGFYTGTQTATASDTNLLAANIKSGTTIFGVAGNLTPAYAACSDNAFNAGQCSTSTNRYVTATLGEAVTISGATSATIPAGFHTGAYSCSVSDANLIASNIKDGVSILGITGSYSGGSSGPVYASNMHRDKTTTQISQSAEASASGTAYTNDDPGYRAVPKISKDDEGRTGGSVTYVDRTGWSATTCGTSQATIAARIVHCATVFGVNATWDGASKGNMGQGEWKLVSRTGDVASMGKEVWQDQRTGLLWSSQVSRSLNWCKASGSNFISGNPAAEDDPSNYCDSATYQNTTGKAISACFEDDGTHFTTTDAGINNNGKAGLNLGSSPAVAWRLPTKNDYHVAEANGIRFVMPDMGHTLGAVEWSASVDSNYRTSAWFFLGSNGNVDLNNRGGSRAVRCVGR